MNSFSILLLYFKAKVPNFPMRIIKVVLYSVFCTLLPIQTFRALSKSFTTRDEETMSDLSTPVLIAKANIWVLSKLFTIIDVAQRTSVHAHVLLKTDGVVRG